MVSEKGGIYIAGAPDFAQVKPFTKAISFHEIALGGARLSGDVIAQIDFALDVLQSKVFYSAKTPQ